MKEEEIKELFEQFEAIANEYEGVECWSARELAQVLGYSKWERFEGVIERAKDTCINASGMVEYHFPGVGRMAGDFAGFHIQLLAGIDQRHIVEGGPHVQRLPVGICPVVVLEPVLAAHPVGHVDAEQAVF